MFTMNNFKKIVHSLHLDELYESLKECHNDNRGGFLIPATVKITDPEYERYRHLPVNWSIDPITEYELPEEFSPRAVKTVDMFRRKTIDLDYECLILFDYITGNVISCNFSDNSGDDKVETKVCPDVLKSIHIASLHNHPKQYCSSPSSKNFQMLGLEFEEFELISSQNELWILKSNEMVFDDEIIAEIRQKSDEYFELSMDDANNYDGYVALDNQNRCYGDLLLNYINNKFNNIKLIRRDLNG